MYYWIVNHAEEHLNINPKKIILVGDSAGGNLASAVTIMAIKNNIKIPDRLILPYPAMSLAKNAVLPSIFYSLSDPILNLNFLNLCFESYIREGSDPETDYMLSPICVTDEILSKFPPVRMMVGTNDPLRDMAYLFLQK